MITLDARGATKYPTCALGCVLKRFYPNRDADLSDIADTTFREETFRCTTEVDPGVDKADVWKVLQI